MSRASVRRERAEGSSRIVLGALVFALSAAGTWMWMRPTTPGLTAAPAPAPAAVAALSADVPAAGDASGSATPVLVAERQGPALEPDFDLQALVAPERGGNASALEGVRPAVASAERLGPVIPAVLDPEATTLRVITGYIPKGGSVGNALGSEGVEPGDVHEITRAMKPVFNFRHAQAGDFFALIADDSGRVLSFEYQRGRSTIYRVERQPSGELAARIDEVPTDRKVLHLGGIIDSSLFEAVTQQGEGPELVQAFADIFVWDIDFSTQTRPGDEFRLVFEKHYDREGFVRYGRVLAAEYATPNRRYTALYFEDEQGYGDYYTPDGKALRRAFLRAPVNYTRISSRYTNSRLHPILKIRRPHQGIDYAAPIGTPVWAVADGEVVFSGWSGGFGRLVKVRHNNGYVSYYGHLSRFGPSIKQGQRVNQKQIVGYVGSSGLSTGPHLDYRLRLNGNFVDPLKVRFPSGEPISVRQLARFNELRDERLAELRAAEPPMVFEAAM